MGANPHCDSFADVRRRQCDGWIPHKDCLNVVRAPTHAGYDTERHINTLRDTPNAASYPPRTCPSF